MLPRGYEEHTNEVRKVLLTLVVLKLITVEKFQKGFDLLFDRDLMEIEDGWDTE